MISTIRRPSDPGRFDAGLTDQAVYEAVRNALAQCVLTGVYPGMRALCAAGCRGENHRILNARDELITSGAVAIPDAWRQRWENGGVIVSSRTRSPSYPAPEPVRRVRPFSGTGRHQSRQVVREYRAVMRRLASVKALRIDSSEEGRS